MVVHHTHTHHTHMCAHATTGLDKKTPSLLQNPPSGHPHDDGVATPKLAKKSVGVSGFGVPLDDDDTPRGSAGVDNLDTDGVAALLADAGATGLPPPTASLPLLPPPADGAATPMALSSLLPRLREARDGLATPTAGLTSSQLSLHSESTALVAALAPVGVGPEPPLLPLLLLRAIADGGVAPTSLLSGS